MRREKKKSQIKIRTLNRVSGWKMRDLSVCLAISRHTTSTSWHNKGFYAQARDWFDKHMPPHNLHTNHTTFTYISMHTLMYSVHGRAAHIASKSNYPLVNVKCAEYFFYRNGVTVVCTVQCTSIHDSSISNFVRPFFINLLHSLCSFNAYFNTLLIDIFRLLREIYISFGLFEKTIQADRSFLSLSLYFPLVRWLSSSFCVRFLFVAVDFIRRRSEYAFFQR